MAGTPLSVFVSLLLAQAAQAQWTTGFDEWTSDARCGGFLSGLRGEFTSPNYPRNYPDYADCTWNIRTSSGQIIQLDFPVVSVEGGNYCQYDGIFVYDGSTNRSRLLGRLCGRQNSSFHSTGPDMTVTFKSDSSSNYPGFQAQYQLVAGGSCRYNCGRQVGNCSCSSQCEYRGDCCPDYYNYCSGATDIPATTAMDIPATTSMDTPAATAMDTPATTAMDTPATTAMDDTTSNSCRYNCGYSGSHCSCQSNCRYYGNCCHDYYDYCLSSTEGPLETTGQRSCQYYCGSHLGSCSCTSSCQSYGNCCYDYRSYCLSTTNIPYTTRDYPSCGETLSGSGSFSSPYYPGYYHDNANCVWLLSVPSGQKVYLSFTELEMENCCGCDYVSVYDGSSVHSPLLGKVCENSTVDTFHSSRNYMTVVFRSDSSVVGRGFLATFGSTLPTHTGRVDCSSDNMNIVIDRSYLNSMGYDCHNMYLNDEYCRPSVCSYQVVFSFPINTCGTKREFKNERVVYTNALRAYQTNSGEISRQLHFKLNVECRMEQDTMVQIMYQTNEILNSSITGSGRFNGSMAFYTSNSFRVQVTDVPFLVNLNQELYIQVRLRRDDSSLVLFLDTCVASPSPHDFHTRSYDLVRSGCRRDSTYYPYLSGTHSVARFSFKAFKFLRTHESVYLQCKILICQASDNNSRCKRGCYSRKARDLGSAHETQTWVLGPVQVKDLEKQEELPEAEVRAGLEA